MPAAAADALCVSGVQLSADAKSYPIINSIKRRSGVKMAGKMMPDGAFSVMQAKKVADTSGCRQHGGKKRCSFSVPLPTLTSCKAG